VHPQLFGIGRELLERSQQAASNRLILDRREIGRRVIPLPVSKCAPGHENGASAVPTVTFNKDVRVVVGHQLAAGLEPRPSQLAGTKNIRGSQQRT
jgi:hypothetical protein